MTIAASGAGLRVRPGDPLDQRMAREEAFRAAGDHGMAC